MALFCLVPRILLYLFSLLLITRALTVDRTGCSTSKGCMFKPAGCNPALDCTLALVFWVPAPNILRVQMVAHIIQPPVSMQYIAIAFSKDAEMGDDAVTECVLASSDQGATEPEIYVSRNVGKTNSRIYVPQPELLTLITNVSASVKDGLFNCEFSQQIIPQIDTRDGNIWPLNQKYHILAATGSAQPNEVNVHDTSPGSQLYPMVSPEKFNPSTIGGFKYPLPPAFVPPTKEVKNDSQPASRISRTSPSVLIGLLSLVVIVVIY